jgi:hypothetical protein
MLLLLLMLMLLMLLLLMLLMLPERIQTGSMRRGIYAPWGRGMAAYENSGCMRVYSDRAGYVPCRRS